MAIRFRCTGCNKTLSIASRKAGARVDCPSCGVELVVPAESPLAQGDEPTGQAPAARPAAPDRPTSPVPPATAESQDPPEALPVSTPDLPAFGSPSAGRPPQASADDDDEGGVSLRRPQTDFDDMDLTPMVDVTFLLLIFFMITASFSLQRTIPIPTPDPEEQGAQQVTQDIEDLLESSLRVTIDPKNMIFVEDDPVADSSTLVDVFRSKRQEENKQEVLLIPDKRSNLQTAVLVVDAANALGMRIRMAASSGDSDD
jgi:biopolymer transport protein ExbD